MRYLTGILVAALLIDAVVGGYKLPATTVVPPAFSQTNSRRTGDNNVSSAATSHRGASATVQPQRSSAASTQHDFAGNFWAPSVSTKKSSNRFEKQQVPPQNNSTDERAQYQWESLLLHELFTTRLYNSQATPALKRNKPVDITLELHVLKIDELIEVNQEIVLSGFLKINWTDSRLKWNASDFGGIDWIVCSASSIWLPDLGLINSYDVYSVTRDSRFPVTLTNNGRVLFVPAGQIRARCELNLKLFPLDSQTCILRFESWMYPTKVIRLYGKTLAVDHLHFTSNPLWHVTQASTGNFIVKYEDYDFSRVDFKLVLERKSLFLIVYTIFPCISLSALQIFSHILPVWETERITFATTALMSFAIFHISIVEHMPKSSDTLPLLAIYVDSLMCLIALSLIECFFLMHWLSKLHGTFALPMPFYWWLFVQKIGKFAMLGEAGRHWQRKYLLVYEKVQLKLERDRIKYHLFSGRKEAHHPHSGDEAHPESGSTSCGAPQFEEYYVNKIYDHWVTLTTDNSSHGSQRRKSSRDKADEDDAEQGMSSRSNNNNNKATSSSSAKNRRYNRRTVNNNNPNRYSGPHQHRPHVCYSTADAERTASPSSPMSPLYCFSSRRPMLTKIPAVGSNPGKQQQQMTASGCVGGTSGSTVTSPTSPTAAVINGVAENNFCTLCGGLLSRFNTRRYSKLSSSELPPLATAHIECLNFNEWRHQHADNNNTSVESDNNSILLCSLEASIRRMQVGADGQPQSNSDNKKSSSANSPNKKPTQPASLHIKKEDSQQRLSRDSTGDGGGGQSPPPSFSSSQLAALRTMLKIVEQTDNRSFEAHLKRDCYGVWTVFITVIDRFVTLLLLLLAILVPVYLFLIYPKVASKNEDEAIYSDDPVVLVDSRAQDLFI